MIMVGDVLKKTSAVFGDEMWDVEDFGRSMWGFSFLLLHLMRVLLLGSARINFEYSGGTKIATVSNNHETL